jgi:hypothetical protein
MKKKAKTLIWLIVAFVAIAFLVGNTDRAKFKEVITGISWHWVVWAVLLLLTAQTILASRWILLLQVHKVYISLYQAVKLTYLGLFYNNMMPGAVGGDIIKGWYITRHGTKDQRVKAAVTVFVDRLVGLIGIVMVGLIASFFVREKMEYEGIQVRWVVWGVFAAMVLVSIVFLSRHVRRLLMISQLLEKLPFAKILRQIDEAIRIYRRHIPIMLMTMLLTAVLQGLAIVAIWMLTQALHLENVTFVQCLIIMPIVWVISSAIPVPGGLGIIENLVTYLFCVVINPDQPGQAIDQAVAMALMYRLLYLSCSMPGAIVPIFGGHLPKADEMQRELEQPPDEE